MLAASATIAQEAERNIGNVEVTGPTPVSSFSIYELSEDVYLQAIARQHRGKC